MGILGIIGGSGVYELEELRDGETLHIETPFGVPSSPLRRAQAGQLELVFLARHGLGHRLSPSEVPYRANVYALKELGVTHLLSLSAVGSLRQEIPPQTLVLPDQIIDRTDGRARTFFEGGVVAHVGLADPFCADFQDLLGEAARAVDKEMVRGGTYICIEGPQFSTRAESQLFRTWGASIIGMTAMPEARLAREAELCYATLAMVTDYDVWHDSEADVSVDLVMSNLHANGESAKAILKALSHRGLPDRSCTCGSALEHAIVTSPAAIPTETRDRLKLLAHHQMADG